MSLPSRVGRDACALADRWLLDPRLADMVVRLSEWWEAQEIPLPSLFVISGQRSQAHNREVGGSPDSRHLQCPSLAVDLRMGRVAGISSAEAWAILGGQWRLMGGRWGGTFSTPDVNHFDLG